MSIVAYVGLPGSGKSYEVVENVIVPAVRDEKRIVTNLAGLKSDEIAAYVLKKWKKVVVPNIVIARNSDIEGPEFFYYEREAKDRTAPAVKAEDTFCKAGDRIVIDEAWRFWPPGPAILPNHMIFFREHRHYTDADSHTSDLILVSQSVADIHPALKRVIERTFKMQKLKELGFSNRYSVFQFAKAKERGSHLQSWTRKYDPQIYALYDSYSAGQGVEKAVDKRESFFGTSKFFWKAGMVLLLFVGGLYMLYDFFTGPQKEAARLAEAEKTKTKGKGGKDGLAKNGGADGVKDVSSVAGKDGAQSAQGEVKGAELPEYEYVGSIGVGVTRMFVLKGPGGKYRYVTNPEGWSDAGRLSTTVQVDGKKISSWGTPAKGGMLGYVEGKK